MNNIIPTLTIKPTKPKTTKELNNIDKKTKTKSKSKSKKILLGSINDNKSKKNKNKLGPIKDNKFQYKKGTYDKTKDIINTSIKNKIDEFNNRINEHQRDLDSKNLSSQQKGIKEFHIKQYLEKIDKLNNYNSYNIDDLDINFKSNL